MKKKIIKNIRRRKSENAASVKFNKCKCNSKIFIFIDKRSEQTSGIKASLYKRKNTCSTIIIIYNIYSRKTRGKIEKHRRVKRICTRAEMNLIRFLPHLPSPFAIVIITLVPCFSHLRGDDKKTLHAEMLESCFLFLADSQ